MTKHTPAPWWHEQPSSLLVLASDAGGKNRIVAGCWGISDELQAEGVANARLIAAAPDMLALLREIADGCGHERCHAYPWIRAARAAIAKAEASDADR